MVIHAVRCDSGLPGHGEHDSQTMYLDQPRLSKGDSRASALRGQVELPGDIDEYLETYDDVNLIIQRGYDCLDFHAQCEELFERLPQPIHPRLPPNVRSYFLYPPTRLHLCSLRWRRCYTIKGVEEGYGHGSSTRRYVRGMADEF